MTFSALGAVPPPTWTAGAVSGWPWSLGPASTTSHSPRRPWLSLYSALSVTLVLFSHTCSAQLDAVQNFCRRFGHQTAVIDRKLYVDGGLINYNPLSQYPANYTNTGLLYHDLDRPGADYMPQLYANLTKNSSVPSVHGGILWADTVNKRFYLFGGEYVQQPPPPQFTLWSFDPLNNEWQTHGSPTRATIGAVSYGAGVSVSERGEGYYYGGWMSNNSAAGWTGRPAATSGLVKYSMDTNSWTNSSGPDSVGRADGAMVFLPISDGGMLVYFGGVRDPHANGSAVGQPMEQIFLYDVLSSAWYSQNATGAVPPMRGRFCAGATWAADQSSYNIYVYGGAGMAPDTAGFDDVYILTIPSFQWIKLWPTDNSTAARPHHSLTCNVIDNSQMLILGGTFPTSDTCDTPTQWGQHNLDMGQQNAKRETWQIYSPNLTSYSVPQPVIDVVGGSANGGATTTAPAKGFTHPDLSVLMARKANLPNRQPSRDIHPGDDYFSKGSSLPAGTIAGIAVGSLAGLALLVVGVYLLIKKCRRKREAKQCCHTPPCADCCSHTPHIDCYAHPASPASPASPYLRRQGTGYSRPAELDVPPSGDWVCTDGVMYELVPSPGGAAASTTVLNGGSSGFDTGASTNSAGDPQTKVDGQGRLWVQVPSPLRPTHAGPYSGSPQMPHHGTAPGFNGTGSGSGGYSPALSSHSARSPRGAPQYYPAVEPQELGAEMPRHSPSGTGAGGLGLVSGQALSEGAGWDAAHGRPKHTTFYHP